MIETSQLRRAHSVWVTLWFLFAAALLSLAQACPQDPNVIERECALDSECGDGKRCDVAAGICLCANDNGCDAQTEFCNALGRCQSKLGCENNDDCSQDGAVPQFCDVTTGQCELKNICDPAEGETCCVIDEQCPFGNICSILDKRCVPGCRDDGDCFLGQGCIGGGFGNIGVCAAGICTGNNLCGFGELCNLATGECTFDTRGSYCFGCAGGVASDDCGDPANYCLTDTTDPTGRSEFCGVDCSQGQPCPFGYSCNDVIIIPPNAPFCTPPEKCVRNAGEQSGTCSRSATSCVIDEDCPNGPPGSDCPRADVGNCINDQLRDCSSDFDCCDGANCPVGSCVKQQCRGDEGDAFGFCTCTRDTDCPRDVCKGADLTDPNNPVSGNCDLSGHRCFEDLDCDVIACIEGGCRIGANCAPADGRSCRELITSDN